MQDQNARDPLRLTVIGGGFTGAVFIIHLIRATTRALDITVIEPRETLGCGTAYSTDDPAHRINVPSDRMAVSKSDPDQATRWLVEHGILPGEGNDDGQGLFYPARRTYGAFIGDILHKTVAEAGARIAFRHLRMSASRVSRQGSVWQVTTDTGEAMAADYVVLCFGHAAPAHPCPISDEAAGHAKFVPDPWAPKAASKINAEDHVLIAGTGLTMADAAVSLMENGHRGPITAVSRRGLTPCTHGLFQSDLDLFPGGTPPRTALGLLRAIRRRVAELEPTLGWQPVADSLRVQLPVVWGGLPSHEKRRVLRKLMPFWEVHRFRIAPQIHRALVDARAAGQLAIGRAGLVGLDRRDGQFAARLCRPGGQVETKAFDAVILCTGPDKNVAANPLIAGLFADGMARLDEVGLGLAVNMSSRILDAEGRPHETLLALGPMTRGTFGEMTGAPDIASHVERIAHALLRSDIRT